MKIYNVDAHNKIHIADFNDDMRFFIKRKFIVKHYTNEYSYNMADEIYNIVFDEAKFLFFSFI